MRLNKVVVNNYRSIKSVTLKLNPTCRVLVGINEAGKSNLLAALSLLDPSKTPLAGDVREPLPGEVPLEESSRVVFHFDLGDADRDAVYEGLLVGAVLDDESDPIVEIRQVQHTLRELVDLYHRGIYVVKVATGARVAAGWCEEATEESLEIVPGWLIPAEGCPPGALLENSEGVRIELCNYDLISPFWTGGSKSGALAVEATARDVITRIGNEFGAYIADSLPKCIYWQHHDEYVLPGRVDLEDFKRRPDSCLPLKQLFSLAGCEVPAALEMAEARPKGLRNLLRRVATTGTAYIHRVWPEYKGISLDLELDGRTIDASIEDVHNLFDLDRRSDGFKRFITFLLMVGTLASTSELHNAVLLQDDPESGLHPSGARHLLRELLRIANTNTVVFATHSIHMIDKDHLGRHLIVRKEAECTTIEEVTESNILDEEVVYNALGFSLTEVLKEKNLVFEGWRDKQLFLAAMKRVPKSFAETRRMKGVGLCHAQGVKGIERVATVLELARRSWVVVSDSDRPAKEHQSRYRGHGAWLCYDQLLPSYPAVTAEDFLKASRLETVLKRVAKQHSVLDTIPAIPNTPGRLRAVREWCQQTVGMDKELVKEFLNDFKQALVTDLKSTHLRVEYYELLRRLNDLLDSAMPPHV